MFSQVEESSSIAYYLFELHSSCTLLISKTVRMFSDKIKSTFSNFRNISFVLVFNARMFFYFGIREYFHILLNMNIHLKTFIRFFM